MNSMLIASASVTIIFAGALLGIGLQRLLPGHHLSKETQDVVKLSGGMIGTLTALVLGLLVSSAKTSFDIANSGIVQTSAKVVLLDRALARYGPDADAAREQLKRSVAAVIDTLWPSERTAGSTLVTMEQGKGVDLLQDALGALQPQSEAQREALSQARQIVTDVNQARWLFIEQEHGQLPVPLLVILVFWLTLLFVSFGLFAPPNTTAVTVLLVGACAVSAAIFLVIEMSQPIEGFITISSAPMRNALQHLNQ
ncbi:MAG: hypothetical protein SF182_03215 [Deltaproteobacteria bacterium]|nr:hypothetical protein [Deltaproteobacteria bacterium]